MQQRVWHEMPLDHVPWSFPDCTVEEADTQSQGTRLPDSPSVAFCDLCEVSVYFNSHYTGAMHVAKTKAAQDSGHCKKEAPTPSAPVQTPRDQDHAASCQCRESLTLSVRPHRPLDTGVQ